MRRGDMKQHGLDDPTDQELEDDLLAPNDETNREPWPSDERVKVTHTSLRRAGLRSRPLLNRLSLIVALLVLAVLGWNNRQTLFHGAGSSARSELASHPFPVRNFPTRTSTPQPPALPPAGTGWVNAGPPGAQAIVFGNGPMTPGYTCNEPTLVVDNIPVPITLGISYDFGESWTTSATPARGVECRLSIDPTDARDLFLISQNCNSCPNGSLPQTRLYRTRDSGHSWSEWTLPPLADGSSVAQIYITGHWAGDDYFVTPWLPVTSMLLTPRLLAVSRHGVPFIWTDQSYLNNTPHDVAINDLYAFSSTLIFDLQSQLPCEPCTHPWRTDDGGLSWQPFDIPNATAAFILVGDTQDGLTLFGHEFTADAQGPGNQRLYRSYNGGQSWQALPPFPGGTVYDFGLMESGGTLYLTLQFSNDLLGIFALKSASQGWTFVASIPGQGEAATVVWDRPGQAHALWGFASLTSDRLHVQLQRHTP